jgi:hypothetical protein
MGTVHLYPEFELGLDDANHEPATEGCGVAEWAAQFRFPRLPNLSTPLAKLSKLLFTPRRVKLPNP